MGNKEFELGLKKIEVEHADFFKDRKCKKHGTKPDKIDNHFTVIGWNESGGIKFDDFCELPKIIQRKVYKLFNEIYHQPNK